MNFKKTFALASFILVSYAPILQAQIIMPPAISTKKDNTKDSYFGKEILDPYRWLEDDNSNETKEWVALQNQNTEAYLKQIPLRDHVSKQLTRLWNYEKIGLPTKEGEYYSFYKNDGLQNQSVLYIQKGLEGEAKEFLNPNTMNKEGTTSLNSVSFSKKQKYCAYSISKAGSDWQDIYVMDVATQKQLDDEINFSKFSGISWRGDEGFYYSGYDKPSEANKFSEATEFQKIFFHKIGTPQSNDELIYEDEKHPQRYKSAYLTEDERFLILSLSEGTDGSEIHYWDMKDKYQTSFQLLCEGFKYNYEVVDNIGDKLIVNTNYNAPNYKLVLIDTKNNGTNNWKNFVAEKDIKLDGVTHVGKRFFCSYLMNATSRIDMYSLEGKFISTIKLPGLGTASGFDGGATDDHTFFSYTSFNQPSSVYKFDLKTNTSKLYKQPKLSIPLAETVVEQIWFTSKDGTQVPMFAYHRKDINLNEGNLPVFLYGYGGFNISLTPSFSVPLTYFVQQGGVYVMVNLRGGSEFGEKWHEAGMLGKKQNVFDDFIGAAEYLIRQKITNRDKIAIHGRSNGGLLVGACMTQRPDLYKVALPGVGVLDMLRYHKFTVGWGWAVEYGSAEKEEDFNYLIKYSPLHNVKESLSYPATMITTADHDDRVVPAHSFKFAATLQEKNKFNGNNPMLIRIDTQAGHGAGKSTTKQIDEWTDVLSFVMHHLQMTHNQVQK
jgi:prolyl oligopeptidase